MVSIQNSLISMDQYVKWSGSENEKKAGLPVNSSQPLKIGTSQLYEMATKFQTNMINLRDFWNRMSTSTNNGELKVFGKELVTRLGTCDQVVRVLIRLSASLHVTLRSFDEVVFNHNKTLSKNLVSAQNNLTNVHAQVTHFKIEMDRAATSRDRNKAYQSWFMWITTEHDARYKLATIQMMQNELAQCQTLLANLDLLENCVTNYQNRINASSIQIKEAHNKEQNALKTTNEKVFSYYQNKVGKHMTNLFDII